MGPDDQRRLRAVTAAAGRLSVDYGSAAAIRALNAAQIPCILLKGPSITRWLYEPEDARQYADCDLLVSPDGFDAAVGVLSRLGFQPELHEPDMPVWWREHALTAVRPEDGAAIDIHRNLPGVHASDELLWSTLSATTDTIVVGDVTAQVLSPPGRLLHIALHTAQHAGSFRDVGALARAIDQIDEETWVAAAGLALCLQAGAAFERGLGFLPDGTQLARRLGVDAAPDIEVELRATNAPQALTLARILHADGLRSRLAIIRHKLAPPATFMRKWSPVARRGRLGLIAAYAWRPVWILGRLPRALRALTTARRTKARRSG